MPADGENEVRAAFSAAASARNQSGTAQEVADRWFFETVVRIHRAGEGAAFTGLKPAGLGHGQVVPVAERAFETGSCVEVAALLREVVEREVSERFSAAMKLTPTNGDVPARRRYVEAVLGFDVWAHRLFEAATAHRDDHEHHHGDD